MKSSTKSYKFEWYYFLNFKAIEKKINRKEEFIIKHGSLEIGLLERLLFKVFWYF